MKFQRRDFASYNPGEFHIDALLTGMLIGYRPQGLIGDQIFPLVPVTKQSNIFPKIDRGAWFRRPTTLRAPGTAPENVRYTVSSDTYFCDNFELGTDIPFETLDNADSPQDPATQGAEFLVDQLMIDQEVRIAQAAWAGCGSSQALTGANAWNDFGGSDPLTNFETAQQAIRQSTHYKPNLAVIPELTWIKLRRHPDIVRAIFPGAGIGGVASPQQLANLLGIDRVLIPEAIQNTGADGLADVFTDVWSTSVVLAYVPPRPGIMVPTFGYAFRWTGPNIGPGNFAVERRRDTKRKTEELQTGYYQDEKIVAPELGFLIATGITG